MMFFVIFRKDVEVPELITIFDINTTDTLAAEIEWLGPLHLKQKYNTRQQDLAVRAFQKGKFMKLEEFVAQNAFFLVERPVLEKFGIEVWRSHS